MTIEELREELLGLKLYIEAWDTHERHLRVGKIVAVEKYTVMHNQYGCCVVRVVLELGDGKIVSKELLYDDMWTLIKYHSMHATFGDGSSGYKFELEAPR